MLDESMSDQEIDAVPTEVACVLVSMELQKVSLPKIKSWIEKNGFEEKKFLAKVLVTTFNFCEQKFAA